MGRKKSCCGRLGRSASPAAQLGALEPGDAPGHARQAHRAWPTTQASSASYGVLLSSTDGLLVDVRGRRLRYWPGSAGRALRATPRRDAEQLACAMPGQSGSTLRGTAR
ncbi:hypothetical protein ACRAWF_33265 [Streptomyces sp. L7]